MNDDVENSLVAYEHHDHVSTITLTDGDNGNPLRKATAEQLLRAVRQARTDAARVIVLASTGRFFSVGGDLSALAASADLSTEIDDLAEALHRVISEIVRSDAIVVSKVQGPAAGAGFPLAFAADVVVASTSARFTLAYTRAGLSIDGGTSGLVNSVGLHSMLRLALLNDSLSAAEAFDLGLVARVVEPTDLDAATDTAVARLANGPRLAQTQVKRLLRDAATPHLETLLRRESIVMRQQASTADAKEGIHAFLEKRPARFNA